MEIKIGTDGFAFYQKEIIPFTIDFIGDNTYLMKKDEEYIEINKFDFDISKEKLEQRTGTLAIVCIETNPVDGKNSAYKVNSVVDDHMLFYFSMRSRYNLTLRYFIILAKNISENIFREMEESPEKLIRDSVLIEL